MDEWGKLEKISPAMPVVNVYSSGDQSAAACNVALSGRKVSTID